MMPCQQVSERTALERENDSLMEEVEQLKAKLTKTETRLANVEDYFMMVMGVDICEPHAKEIADMSFSEYIGKSKSMGCRWCNYDTMENGLIATADKHESNGKTLAEVLNFIAVWGCIDGGHHKQWVLDQLVQIILKTRPLYHEWVTEWEYGEDGAKTYEWDTGIAP